MVRRRAVVAGQVQGVFFRDTCRRVALQHGVAGWVRNRPDGTVEAVFEGAQRQVDRLVEWVGRGPERAVVQQVTVSDEPPEGLTSFTVR